MLFFVCCAVATITAELSFLPIFLPNRASIFNSVHLELYSMLVPWDDDFLEPLRRQVLWSWLYGETSCLDLQRHGPWVHSGGAFGVINVSQVWGTKNGVDSSLQNVQQMRFFNGPPLLFHQQLHRLQHPQSLLALFVLLWLDVLFWCDHYLYKVHWEAVSLWWAVLGSRFSENFYGIT